MKYFGYAECNYCKNKNGPWILFRQKFICEDCYNRKFKKIKANINENIRRLENDKK